MRSLGVVVVLTGSAAAATPMTITGSVSNATSRWTADGTRIVTEATVQTADGPVVVSQLGGTVDGIGMRTFPSPERLVPGMQVTIAAHPGLDLAQREHIVVDDVKVDAWPADFVRTGPTKAGHYLYWESGCIFVTVDSAGTKEVAGDQEFPVIDTSIATWNNDTASCSYLKVMENARAPVEVGKDHVNVIKFRDDSWCRPAIGDDPARCYNDSAAGLTTATYIDDGGSSRDGAIVDMDVELNGKNFAISVNGVTLGTQPCKADLQNTLTHELGHLHGLEHTCLAGGDPPRVDNTGKAVPSCASASLPPAITEATMYNYQDCGETKKATLEADDIAAICTIYPTAKDPHQCEPVTGGDTAGCCDAHGAPPTGPFALAALTGAALLVRRRRARR